jgi:hypothetical protein
MLELIAAIAAASSATPASPAGGWRTYANARYGYHVCYPASLLKPRREADNGDGRVFAGPNGAELRVFGQFDGQEDSFSDWAAKQAASYTGKRGRITYRAAGSNWAVLSGRDGGAFAFYMKVVRREDELVTFQLKYPVSEARRFRPVVERLSRCFGLDRLPD